jgi:hypothetical protein
MHFTCINHQQLSETKPSPPPPRTLVMAVQISTIVGQARPHHLPRRRGPDRTIYHGGAPSTAAARARSHHLLRWHGPDCTLYRGGAPSIAAADR